MKTVIEMAKEAGDDWDSTLSTDKQFLERFAELVRADAIADERERIYFQTSSDFVKAAVAEEREACAKVAEQHPAYDWAPAVCEITYAIRARRNTC